MTRPHGHGRPYFYGGGHIALVPRSRRYYYNAALYDDPFNVYMMPREQQIVVREVPAKETPRSNAVFYLLIFILALVMVAALRH